SPDLFRVSGERVGSRFCNGRFSRLENFANVRCLPLAPSDPTRGGPLPPRVNQHDWEEVKVWECDLVTVIAGGIDVGCRVQSVLLWAGGEPEAWMWLVESQTEPSEFPFDE